MTFDDEILAATPQKPGVIVISGIFNGNIHNGIIVYVTSCGCFNGNIISKNLIIEGKVTGNVQVENLKICASGKLYVKEIQYNNLTIEEGGLLIENPATIELKPSPAQFNANAPIIKDSGKQVVASSNSSNEFVHFDCSF